MAHFKPTSFISHPKAHCLVQKKLAMMISPTWTMDGASYHPWQEDGASIFCMRRMHWGAMEVNLFRIGSWSLGKKGWGSRSGKRGRSGGWRRWWVWIQPSLGAWICGGGGWMRYWKWFKKMMQKEKLTSMWDLEWANKLQVSVCCKVQISREAHKSAQNWEYSQGSSPLQPWRRPHSIHYPQNIKANHPSNTINSTSPPALQPPKPRSHPAPFVTHTTRSNFADHSVYQSTINSSKCKPILLRPYIWKAGLLR